MISSNVKSTASLWRSEQVFLLGLNRSLCEAISISRVRPRAWRTHGDITAVSQCIPSTYHQAIRYETEGVVVPAVRVKCSDSKIKLLLKTRSDQYFMQEARCPTDGKMYDSAPSLHLTAGGPLKLTRQHHVKSKRNDKKQGKERISSEISGLPMREESRHPPPCHKLARV